MDKFNLDKAIRALRRVEIYLRKQKINKKPARFELVTTYQFVTKTLKEIDTENITI